MGRLKDRPLRARIVTALKMAKGCRTAPEMARALGCTAVMIRKISTEYGIPYKQIYKAWTTQEQQKVLRLISHGLLPADVARATNRTKGSVSRITQGVLYGDVKPVCRECYHRDIDKFISNGCQPEDVTWHDVEIYGGTPSHIRYICTGCGAMFKSVGIYAQRELEQHNERNKSSARRISRA